MPRAWTRCRRAPIWRIPLLKSNGILLSVNVVKTVEWLRPGKPVLKTRIHQEAAYCRSQHPEYGGLQKIMLKIMQVQKFPLIIAHCYAMLPASVSAPYGIQPNPTESNRIQPNPTESNRRVPFWKSLRQPAFLTRSEIYGAKELRRLVTAADCTFALARQPASSTKLQAR